MSKLAINPDRSKLPQGWHWANWSRKAEAKRFWSDANHRIVQRFRHRFMELAVARENGRPLSSDKVSFDRKIGKARIHEPNPGWRAWFFQDGAEYLLTHITRKSKSKKDHEKQIAVALQAREEHRGRKKL